MKTPQEMSDIAHEMWDAINHYFESNEADKLKILTYDNIIAMLAEREKLVAENADLRAEREKLVALLREFQESVLTEHRAWCAIDCSGSGCNCGLDDYKRAVGAVLAKEEQK